VGPGGRVHVTDLAPSMVEAVAASARDLPWVTTELRDAEDPPEGPWDLVQASLVLFMLPDVAPAVRRCRAVLAAGGRLAFTWFGDQDPTWEPLFKELAAPLPADRRPPRGLVRGGPFAGPEAMAAFLAEARYAEVSTTTERVSVTVRDPEHYWRWMWSQGMRGTLEALASQDDLEPARATLFAALEERQAREGSIGWWADIRYTVARS